MSIITLGIANQPNVSITMFNTLEEDERLEQSEPKDMNGAQYGMARKRLFSDTMKDVDDKGKIVIVPHCSETVVFPQPLSS